MWKIPRIYRWKRSLWPRLKHNGPYNEEKLISVAQAAKRYHVTRSTIRYWIGARKVYAIKRGGKWWIYPIQTS